MIINLEDAERGALAYVMEARYENIVETRQQTGDSEFDQDDEDRASVLVFMLNDFDLDPELVPSMDPLYDAIWIALDTPYGFDDIDRGALRSAAAKVGYESPT